MKRKAKASGKKQKAGSPESEEEAPPPYEPAEHERRRINAILRDSRRMLATIEEGVDGDL